MIEKDREINKSQDFLNKSITELNQKDVYLTHLIQDNTKLQGQFFGITSELITNLSHNDRVEILQSLINEDINSVTSLKSKLAKALESRNVSIISGIDAKNFLICSNIIFLFICI